MFTKIDINDVYELGIIRIERDDVWGSRKSETQNRLTQPFIQCVKRFCISYLREPHTLSRSILI